MLFNSIDIDGLAVYCLRLGMSEIAYMCLGIDIDGLGFFVVTLLLLLLLHLRKGNYQRIPTFASNFLPGAISHYLSSCLFYLGSLPAKEKRKVQPYF